MGLLWFRRSRGKEATPEPQAEWTPPPEHTRAPVRLRGLLLLNLKPADGVEQIETAPPLGDRASVIRALQSIVPGISFDEDGRGEAGGPGHRLSLDLGRHAQAHAAVASAEGDEGIEMLRAVLAREGWRAYAPRANVFLEPDALDLFALPE
jgi:hypothetical protein